MDKDYIARTIERIQDLMKRHDHQFAGRPEHANCLERFQRTIERLQEELEKVTSLAAQK